MIAEPSSGKESGDRVDAARSRLAAEIAADFAHTARWTGLGAPSRRVLAALMAVPREKFVPEGEAGLAYANRPLPIGRGQTISQPFVVALMTDMLDIYPGARVLEIGTGSGYQAAVLAEAGAKVFSVEAIPELAVRAASRLAQLGYKDVAVRSGDGNLGWPEEAPFDRVVVTAAAPAVPPALVAQMRAGGRLVIPVGPEGGEQRLCIVEKSETGKTEMRATLGVAFVPLVGGAALPV